MPAPAASSLRTVVVALAANLGVAVAKLVAALLTGSSGIMAEAFHAFADAGNEVLLLVSHRRSQAPPDEAHPLGHGREAYFWALIASIGVFVTGALLSLREGVNELGHPHAVTSFAVGYATLAVSLVLEGASLLQAYRQLRAEARAAGREFLEHLDLSSDPVARAVFAEDAAALVGNALALIGLALHQVTGSALPDGLAALAIGVLIGVVALQLARRNGDFLIGRQVSPALRARIEVIIAAEPGIVAVTELLVSFLGPRRIWVVARVIVDGGLNGTAIAAMTCATEASLMRASPFIARVDLVPRGS